VQKYGNDRNLANFFFYAGHFPQKTLILLQKMLQQTGNEFCTTLDIKQVRVLSLLRKDICRLFPKNQFISHRNSFSNDEMQGFTLFPLRASG